jgi:tetratricopeptide (TPR) repeat protein
MLPKIRIMPNLSTLLVAGLVLGVLPWVISGYLFPRVGRCTTAIKATDVSVATTQPAKPARLVLPPGESVRRLQPLCDQRVAVLTSACPSNPLFAEQDVPDFGPTLIGPTVSESLHRMPAGSAPADAVTPDPTTDTEGSSTPRSYPPTESAAHQWDAVPSPAASENHGSVPVEAASTTPAVQSWTAPSVPERMPAHAELLTPSSETESTTAARRGAPAVRSEQLESIARQADANIRHGFELAGRGAYYAARSEFIAALRLLAQGLDTDRQTTIHGKSLAAGLTAMKEADDFLPRGSMLEANLDIPALVASHITPVLKKADNAQTTSLAALKSYLTYAQQQFAIAADGEMSGSMALRGLGRLHEELAKNQNSDVQAAAPKAVALYQAALLVAPTNFMAANDLGVMLARAGNLDDARMILEHGAATARESTILNNLALVYQRLGRSDLATQTRQQSLVAQQAEQARRQNSGVAASNASVQWIAPDAFARTSPNLASPPAVANKPTTTSQAPRGDYQR